MTSPITSVLVTDWSRQHIAGHNLDGGGLVSFNLDTTIVGTEALGRDVTQWNVGDIATLKVDPETHLAQLRIVTPRQYIVRAREFQIFDITHTVDNVGEAHEGHGRHIFLQGTTENGAVYVMPMLGYTIWESAWDLTSLQGALQKAEIRQQSESGLTPHISHDITIDEVGSASDEVKLRIEQYNNIFYPGTKSAGTVFDRAISFTVKTMTVKQTGSATRAQMFTAAFVKKTKEAKDSEADEFLHTKRGTAFSQPYFVVDGEKVFIRTSSAS